MKHDLGSALTKGKVADQYVHQDRTEGGLTRWGTRQVIALAVRESAPCLSIRGNVPYSYTDQESRESVDVP
jgi:hypothetical protein